MALARLVAAHFFVLLLAQAAAATQGAGRGGVSSDFFEDALPAAGEAVRGLSPSREEAPYDVGNDAVPLPNEFETADPWKSLLPPRPALSLASSGSSVAPAAADTVAAPAPPPLRTVTPAEQLAALREPLREVGADTTDPLMLEEAAQAAAETPAMATSAQAARPVAVERPQQAQAVRAAATSLPRRTASSHSAADRAAEAARFYQDQGDLGGQDPDHAAAAAAEDAAAAAEDAAESRAKLVAGLDEDMNLASAGTQLQRGRAAAASASEDEEVAAPLPPRRPRRRTAAPAAQPFPSEDASKESTRLQEARLDQEVAKLRAKQRQLQALEANLRARNASFLAASQRHKAWANWANRLHGPRLQPAPRRTAPLPQAEASEAAYSQQSLLGEENYVSNVGAVPQETVDAPTRSGMLAAPQEQAYAPDHMSCTPQCTYQCVSPKCDEECAPECQSPTCQTRCAGTDLSGCHMSCGKPHCSVVCPKRACSGENCPQCTTHCSEPMCMLQCPKEQPCRNVCEEPKCDWKCRAPQNCPKPKCSMVCEAPRQCVGSTYRTLPPLAPGEAAVESFKAPSGLIQTVDTEKASAPFLRGTRFAQAPIESPYSTLSVPVEGRRARVQEPYMEALPDTSQWTVNMPVATDQKPSQNWMYADSAQ